jgi:hypothetical protein
MAKRIRISKKLLKELPTMVAEKVKRLADGYGIKSTTIESKPEGYKVYPREGDRVEMVYGENSQGIEFFTENSVGASGVSYNLSGHTEPPAGTWVIRVSYYTKYWMDIVNVGQRQLPA